VYERAQDPPWNMLAAMGLAAFLCVFIGIYTPYLYNLLPYHEAAVAYHPYTAYHVSETLLILLFTALAFFVLVRLGKIEPHRGLNLDLDWFYRLGGRAFLWLARRPVQSADTGVGEVYRVGGLVPLMKSAGRVDIFDNGVIDGAVDGFASAVRSLGRRLRLAQRGALQENLTLVFAIGAILLLGFLMFL
jgi:multicomponent Na+:H+ antiporter subunit D